MTVENAVTDFLAQKSIAVVGLSHKKENTGNVIYRKLRDSGYRVFAVNPNADTLEGDPCYPDLASVPEAIDGVVIATRPEVTLQVVQQCVKLKIPRVWMHQSFKFLGTSVSDKAVEACRQHGVTVIPGGCPMMFCEPVDFVHRCFRGLALRKVAMS